MELSFRPLDRADLPRLGAWLAEPHVDAWWHEAFDLAGLEAKYGPCIDGLEPTYVFVIEKDGTGIGLIQWYRWVDHGAHARQIGAGMDTAGIDLFIGAADLVGRGLGPRAIAAFLDGVVFTDPAIAACVADPETRNARSLRAFAKAGFREVATVRLRGESVWRTIVRRERG